MQKRNIQPFSTFAGVFIYQAHTFGLGVTQRGLYIIYAVSYMVNTRPFFLQKLGYGAIFRGRLQQFYFGASYPKKGGFHLLVGHFFNTITLQAQYSFIKRQGLFYAANSNTQMFNV